MHFVQIFIATVVLVNIYVYKFMVLLKSNLKKSIFFPVFKVFITKIIACLQPLTVSRLVIRFILM